MPRLYDLVEPNGMPIFQVLTTTTKPFEKAMSFGDLSTLASIYDDCAKLFFDLVPHIPNNNVSKAVFDMAKGCVTLSKRLANGTANLHDISDFEKEYVIKVLEAEGLPLVGK